MLVGEFEAKDENNDVTKKRLLLQSELPRYKGSDAFADALWGVNNTYGEHSGYYTKKSDACQGIEDMHLPCSRVIKAQSLQGRLPWKQRAQKEQRAPVERAIGWYTFE